MKFFRMFLVVLAMILLAGSAYAQEIVPVAPAIPDWVAGLLSMISSLPTVGPILSKIATIAAIVSAILTVLVACAYGLLKVPEIAARLAGKKELADKILAIADKVIYYLKYFSMMNAKKPEGK